MDVEVTYEIYVDDECLAISSSWEDACHYYSMYADDGLVTLVKATTTRELITEDQ